MLTLTEARARSEFGIFGVSPSSLSNLLIVSLQVVFMRSPDGGASIDEC